MARDDNARNDAPWRSCGAAKRVNLSPGFVRVFRVLWIIWCSALVVMSVISLALAAEPLGAWLAVFGISAAALPAGLLFLALIQKRWAAQLEQPPRDPSVAAACQKQTVTFFDRIWVGAMGSCFLASGVWMLVRPQPWWLVDDIEL